jgi:protein-S-isoprenylcysteine O-methyltransferase Ste14
MKRHAILAYGIVVYLLFLVAFNGAVLFVQGLLLPTTLASLPAEPGPVWRALLIDAGLLGLFAVQHSVMARRQFKQRWTRIVHPAIERSTFVLATVAILFLTFSFWQPLPGIVWSVSGPLAYLLTALSWAGWLLVLAATFVIDHFDLFGLKQVIQHFRGAPHREPRFKVRLFYRWTRHPLYLGFFIAFWSTPLMTSGHLLFAAMVTAWVLFAVQLEERDLVAEHGEAYRQYRRRVPMFLPSGGPGYVVPRSASGEARARRVSGDTAHA